MSNDLISRKEVLAIISPRLDSSKIGSLEHQRIYSIFEEVKNLPTTYDVDKVVEQIEAERKEAEEYNQSSAMIAHEIDIEIVKSGGIE